MPNLGKSFNSGNTPADIARQRIAADGISSTGLSAFGESSASLAYDGWDGLALDYSIDWPLQLLFTQEVLAK